MIDQYYTDKDEFLVVLDSRNASEINNNPFNSSIQFNFENSLLLTSDYINLKCSVFSFVCPNSIYLINETNCFISITYNLITYNINLKLGNYNAYTFMTQLLLQIGNNFTMSFDPINNIFTLTNSLYDFSINSTTTMYNIIGISKNTTYNSTNKTLTMPFTCNFNGIQNINIHFTNLTTQNVDSLTQSSSSVIQSIPVNVNSQQITFNKTTNFGFNIIENNLDFINIELRDDLGNLINLNNQHFNLSLLFTKIKNYKRFAPESFESILQDYYDEY